MLHMAITLTILVISYIMIMAEYVNKMIAVFLSYARAK